MIGLRPESSLSYEGGRENGLYEGTGVLTREGEWKYEGEFVGGKRHGEGTLTFLKKETKNKCWVGEYKNGKKDGKGVLFFKNGSRVKGEWKNGKFASSIIEYVFGSGTTYIGEFRNPGWIREGDGEMRFSSGSWYKGQWKGGKKHGQGSFFNHKKGETFTGEFSEGKFVGDIIRKKPVSKNDDNKEIKRLQKKLEIEREKSKLELSLKNEEIKKLEESVKGSRRQRVEKFIDVESIKVNFQIPQDNLTFDLEKRLGEGGCGKVFEAKQKDPKRKIALKLLPYGIEFERTKDDVLKEFYSSIQLVHESVIRTFGFYEVKHGVLGIAMEKMDGNIHDYVLLNVLNLEEKFQIMMHITRGICFLHNKKPNRILHRDIKGANFLYRKSKGKDLEIKVCDFGLAKKVTGNTGAKTTDINTKAGSKLWMPPEVGEKKYSVKSDVYSLGVTFWEILFERYPFGDVLNADHVPYLVQVEKKRPNLELYEESGGVLPSSLKDLLRWCWDPDRKKRPSANKLMKWLEDNDFDFSVEHDETYFPSKKIQEENRKRAAGKVGTDEQVVNVQPKLDEDSDSEEEEGELSEEEDLGIISK